MVKATKAGLYILQSCSIFASHSVKDVEIESVIAVLASIFALKIGHVQLVVWCIYATGVPGNEGPAFTFFTFNLLLPKQKNYIFFCKRLKQ